MDDKKQSRINRFEKRRKNTKSISILIVVGSILLIILLAIGIFGGGEEQNKASEVVISNPESTGGSSDEEDMTVEEDEQEGSSEDEMEEDTEIEEDEEKEDEEENNEDKELEETEPTDGHAIESYTADWEPIGTEQEGPHTTNYSDGSQDRIEIKEAVVQVTELNPDDMIEWRIANGGDQKVIATVSDGAQSEIYRVFLSWVDGEGWQPTQLEVLDEVVY